MIWFVLKLEKLLMLIIKIVNIRKWEKILLLRVPNLNLKTDQYL
jgi:hypothetical protein